MVITGFRAEKVFGYLEFNIQFNKDVNFLVGGNGAGKTTALRLINAMLVPNFKELLQIPFDQAWLLLEDDSGENRFISIMSEGENKVLHISGTPEKLVLPTLSGFDIDFINRSNDKLDDLIEDITRKYASHDVVKRISGMQSPIFLGLDRHTATNFDPRHDYMLEREIRQRSVNHRDAVSKRLVLGALTVGLIETELLVQNAYRRLRELEERQSTRLRDSILLSSFKFTRFSLDTKPFVLSENERHRLLNRKIEIKDALTKIGVRNSKLGSELNEFFSQLATLFENPNTENSGIEWLLNKAQIDRMSRIVELIDEHKSKVDEIFLPINSFLSTINGFLKDTHKVIEMDAVGQLRVKRPDGTKSGIDALSSGERQLLVIFAHACLNRHSTRNTVFIVDEPELSLHLSWQEKFSETIFEISPSSQFILATHSPEIVGVNKSKAVQCR